MTETVIIKCVAFSYKSKQTKITILFYSNTYLFI